QSDKRITSMAELGAGGTVLAKAIEEEASRLNHKLCCCTGADANIPRPPVLHLAASICPIVVGSRSRWISRSMKHPDEVHAHNLVPCRDPDHQIAVLAVEDARIETARFGDRLATKKHHAEVWITEMQLLGHDAGGQRWLRKGRRNRLKVLAST